MDAVLHRRGLMLVLSSPSGAGKTTIARRMLKDDTNLSMSVSATTRPKRPGEVSGVDYQFVDKTTFNLLLNRGELLEHARVFSNYYGTPRGPVEKALSSGRDMLFDIDWQGTQQLREAAREDLVSIFILPPSTRALEDRLAKRAQDPPEVVAERMSKAADEMSHWPEYDYVIVNDDLESSVTQVKAILAAERARRSRLLGLGEFVRGLQAGH
jgi:guanylate kinase